MFAWITLLAIIAMIPPAWYTTVIIDDYMYQIDIADGSADRIDESPLNI